MIVWWVRDDARISNNPTLNKAIELAKKKGEPLVAIYGYPARWNKPTSPLQFKRIGNHQKRVKFIALQALKESLQKNHNIPLWIFDTDFISLLKRWNHASSLPSLSIVTHHGLADEECRDENHLIHWQQNQNQSQSQSQNQANLSVEFYRIWSNGLFSIDELPFRLENLPKSYTSFRKKIEPCIPDYSFKIFNSPSYHQEEWLEVPTTLKPLEIKLNFEGASVNASETAGRKRLITYLWETHHVQTYQETRNLLLGENFSTRFSIFLAVGSLSPQTIMAELQRYEKRVCKNKSTYWVWFELLWREYFRWVAYQAQGKLFLKQGLKPNSPYFEEPEATESDFKEWIEGNTGEPFIDAGMRELKQTGWLSNRMRQNVANYWVKTMKGDWRWGAQWFEHQLVDYDVHSNWGNWAYQAGVGNDSRADRRFNPKRQAEMYDADFKYQNHWLSPL